ncbi:MAG: ROK family protein [Bacteroidetes bacterium]|nr:ROK family protein [Bacteroidota bacterium]
MDNKNLVLGIDIGGTNTVLGLVDEAGKIFAKETLPTNGRNSAADFFERLFGLYSKLLINAPKDSSIIGIGIGAPNGNFYKCTIENPPNLNWGHINVAEVVKKYINVPVAVTNDANAAALGEMKFGAAIGMKNFVEITLGTGLGSGIVVNGELVYGHDGFAGEIGHTNVKPNGRLCGCGMKGCLETYVSAPGIKRTVFKLMSVVKVESHLRDVTFNQMDSKMIFDAAKEGDIIALEAFDYTAKILGMALAGTAAYLSPEAIIIFGGLANAGDFLLEPVKHYMEENLFPAFRNKVKILPSGLKEGDAAVLGASALIWHELNK